MEKVSKADKDCLLNRAGATYLSSPIMAGPLFSRWPHYSIDPGPLCSSLQCKAQRYHESPSW